MRGRDTDQGRVVLWVKPLFVMSVSHVGVDNPANKNTLKLLNCKCLKMTQGLFEGSCRPFVERDHVTSYLATQGGWILPSE